MTAAAIHLPTAPPAPASPGSRMLRLVILALTLWLIWCTPLLIMALTGQKFVEIFKEFGVKLSSAVLLALQVGGLMGSPLGFAFMLLALPALCFAVSALILPPRPALGTPQRARWPLVVIAIVGSLVGAVALWLIYTAIMAQAMLPIIDKLQKSPPATTTAVGRD